MISFFSLPLCQNNFDINLMAQQPNAQQAVQYYYQQLLQYNTWGEGLAGLKTLLQQDQQIFLSLPNTILQTFCQMLQYPVNDQILCDLFDVVTLITNADVRGSDSVFNSELHNMAMFFIMREPFSQPVATSCFNFLEALSIVHGSDFIEFPFEQIIGRIQQVPLATQKEAFKMLDRVTCFSFHKRFLQMLPEIAIYLTYSDKEITRRAARIIADVTFVFEEKELSSVLPDFLIHRIIMALKILTDFKTIDMLLKIIRYYTVNTEVADKFINEGLDLQLIYEINESNNKKSGLLWHIILIILRLLPPAKYNSDYFMYRKLTYSCKFAAIIMPFIEIILLKESDYRLEILAALSSIVRIVNLEHPNEVLNLLQTYSLKPEYSDMVFIVLANLKDKSILSHHHFDISRCNHPEAQEIKEELAPYIKQIVDTQKEIEINSIEDFIQFSKSDSIVLLLMQPVNVQILTNFLNTQSHPFSDEMKLAIENIASVSKDLVSLQQLPPQEEFRLQISADSIKSQKLNCKIQIDDQKPHGTSAPLEADFAFYEAWYNYMFNLVTKTDFDNNILKRCELSRIVTISPFDQLEEFSHQSLFSRALEIPGYIKLHFSFDGHKFSVYDNVFQSIASVFQSPNKIQNQPILIKFHKGDHNREEFPVPKFSHDEIDVYLNLLKRIHELYPNYPMISSKFDKLIQNDLIKVEMTFTKLSYSSTIIYHYPFMFSMQTRKLFNQMTAFDFNYAVFVVNKYFHNPDDSLTSNQIRIKVHINRKNVFNDGAMLFSKFGFGRSIYDVAFENEVGIGYGPTREFFYLFTKELLNTDRKLWRCSYKDTYINPAEGIFPRPDANLELINITGICCAKAYQMECMISLRFHPAFIKLLRGKLITVEEVDSVLANSLSYPEGLIDLPFTYPGFPEIELKPNGSAIMTNQQNVQEYIDLVKEFTCSPVHYRNIVAAFLDGFQKVVCLKAFDLFSEGEFISLLSGSGVDITSKDLFSFVKIGSGYQSHSPQISWLFEFILEMTDNERKDFIRFITGFPHLPIGGLAELHPPLTIGVHFVENGLDDTDLPSALTCGNYLKIPKYSSKAILKEKMRIAMTEGQEAFFYS